MRRWLIILIILTFLGIGGAVGGPKGYAYWRKRNQPKFRTAKVTRGPVAWEVRTSGKVQPVLRVSIGSFVSGPVSELHANFNDYVKKGQLLARIDPRIYAAAVRRDEAALAVANADTLRVLANLHQARNDERRSKKLRDINPEYISDTEMDQFRFAREALEAQLEIAKESAKQAQGRLDDSKANLQYTEIVAPCDGVVIDRKIDEGQTLAAQFQTPELFVLAPEMEKRMWIEAMVLEADIGMVRKAKDRGQDVEFTIEAYQDELFHGKIKQVRQNPTTEQNVVTYPVIVEAPNPDLKLLPGMTAVLSFEVERKDEVLRIPGGAIRFLPDVKHVRKEDKDLIEGDDVKETGEDGPSAKDRVSANQRRRRRHVWIQDGEFLKAIPIEFGITDGKVYELAAGELIEGQELVTGLE